MKGERCRACSDFFPMYLAQSSHLTQSRSHQRSCQLPGVIPIGDSHITGSNQQFVPLASPVIAVKTYQTKTKQLSGRKQRSQSNNGAESSQRLIETDTLSGLFSGQSVILAHGFIA